MSWITEQSGERTIRYFEEGTVFFAYARKMLFNLLAGAEKSGLYRSLNLTVLLGAAKIIELQPAEQQ